MPLDEKPNLISLLLSVERAAIDDLYRSLAAAGHEGLAPASAAVFQHIRPGGSRVAELARLGQMSEAAVHEQVRDMQAAGYVRADHDGRVTLTPRGEAAVTAGMQALTGIERRWRDLLGENAYSAFVSALARLNLER
jgi:DNA-binding MarR family transcriptional regulator